MTASSDAAPGDETRFGALPRWLAVLDRAMDAVSTACLIFAGTLLFSLIVIFGWLVFGRYILNDTPTWVEQVSLVIVVYVTFIGAAVGIWRRAHLSIDFIRESLPSGIRAALHAVADLSVMAFAGVMAWHGWKLTLAGLGRQIPLLGISEGWRYAPLLIAGVLIVAFTLVDMLKRAFAARRES